MNRPMNNTIRALTLVAAALAGALVVGCGVDVHRHHVNPCHDGYNAPGLLYTEPQQDTTAEQAKQWATCDSVFFNRPRSLTPSEP